LTFSRDAIEVCPVAPRIGAEITGIRLSGTLEESSISAIRRAVLKHKVVFLRGQHHLDDNEQHAFAMRLGTVSAQHAIAAKPDVGGLFIFDSSYVRAAEWHHDTSYVADYPAFSVGRAAVMPSFGGDTVWANTATAYEDLPQQIAALAESLWGIHNNVYRYPTPTNAARDFAGVYETVHFETEHPLVRVHPETKERALVLGDFVHGFVGLPPEDSDAIHSLFHRYITRLENTVRWRWTLGDIAIWDNRATLHVGINDYGSAPRCLHRITVDGEVPVAVDGRSSVVRVGADSAWYRRPTSQFDPYLGSSLEKSTNRRQAATAPDDIAM
jgi:alpha-ketoglutarate-dependent sulfate ester dioxygenase